MTSGTDAPARWPVIAKDPAGAAVPPNLADYDATCAFLT